MAQSTETDPVEELENIPGRLGSFFTELYKTLRDKKQQEEQQKAMQRQAADQAAHQENLQKQQQQFMAEQNERLMDVMQQSGIPLTDGNVKAGQAGLTRLERLASNEGETAAKLEGIDKQIQEVDAEQRALLAPPVDIQAEHSKIDAEVGRLAKEQQTADDIVKQQEAQLKRQPGMTPEKLKEQMAPVLEQKAKIDENIKKDVTKLAQAKAAIPEPVDLVKVDKDLKALDAKQQKADDMFKQKQDHLLKTPGIEPDALFKGMEDLKKEKEGIDKGIQSERKGLEKLKEKPLTPDEKTERLKELHEKKAGLMKEKGPLQEKMKGIETERTALMKGKGMEGLQTGQGQGQGQGVKGPGKGVNGDGAKMFGGVDISNARPGSTGETIAKGMKPQKAGGLKVDELSQKVGKKAPKVG